MPIKSFLISCLAICVLVVYLIVLLHESNKCDGVLVRGSVWYVCVKDNE